MTLKEFLENGEPEQIERLRASKTKEEMLILAKEFGINQSELEDGEITEEELEAISGGGPFGFVFVDQERPNPYRACPNCGATGTIINGKRTGDQRSCSACGRIIK